MAVHGLAGGSISTWSNNGSCWLTDLLPRDLKDVRVLAFGYAATEACLEQKKDEPKVSGRLLTFAEELCNDLADLDSSAVVC